MGTDKEINRRSLIVRTAGAIGAAGAITAAEVSPALTQADQQIPPGFDVQQPLIQFWNKPLNQVVEVDLRKDAPDLADAAARERHRLYCHLLMKLIVRFWNGNKHGPRGSYPLRAQQRDPTQLPQAVPRYRGDMAGSADGLRINWDRYLGHNIACLAVDGNGEIIDFDFNHNDLFRSSAEHAESRMVRRLFSLTDIFDTWHTGHPIGKKPKAASLNAVTLYTSLESCAQCSGVMSLAGIKQIVYLQNDFTAYKIGNIMYNLANRLEAMDWRGRSQVYPARQFLSPRLKSDWTSSATSMKHISRSPKKLRLPHRPIRPTLQAPFLFRSTAHLTLIRRLHRSSVLTMLAPSS